MTFQECITAMEQYAKGVFFSVDCEYRKYGREPKMVFHVTLHQNYPDGSRCMLGRGKSWHHAYIDLVHKINNCVQTAPANELTIARVSGEIEVVAGNEELDSPADLDAIAAESEASLGRNTTEQPVALALLDIKEEGGRADAKEPQVALDKPDLTRHVFDTMAELM